MHDCEVSVINPSDVVYAPKLGTNLVSLGQLVDDGNLVYFYTNVTGPNRWKVDLEGA